MTFMAKGLMADSPRIVKFQSSGSARIIVNNPFALSDNPLSLK